MNCDIQKPRRFTYRGEKRDNRDGFGGVRRPVKSEECAGWVKVVPF